MVIFQDRPLRKGEASNPLKYHTNNSQFDKYSLTSPDYLSRALQGQIRVDPIARLKEFYNPVAVQAVQFDKNKSTATDYQSTNFLSHDYSSSKCYTQKYNHLKHPEYNPRFNPQLDYLQ